MSKHSIINFKLIAIALFTLISGYALMAFKPSTFIVMNVAPIVIIIAFVLVVLSVFIPVKKHVKNS